MFTTNLLSDIDISSSVISGPSILNSEGPRQQISVKTPHFVEIDLPECWVGRLLPIKQYYKYDHLKHIESKHGVVIQVSSINLLKSVLSHLGAYLGAPWYALRPPWYNTLCYTTSRSPDITSYPLHCSTLVGNTVCYTTRYLFGCPVV